MARITLATKHPQPPAQTASNPLRPMELALFYYTETLSEQGLSTDTLDIILSSWRKSTQRQYACFIERWLRFSSTEQVDPVNNNMYFFKSLTYFDNSQLKYNAFGTARYAVSKYILLCGGLQLFTTCEHFYERWF